MRKKIWDSFFQKRGRYYLVEHPQLHKVISKFKAFRVHKVLDLGCGSGRHSIALAKAGFNLTGIDFSSEALKLARKWAKKENLEISFKKGNFHKKLHYKDKTFDAIIAISVLQYHTVEAVAFTLSEMNRILKDNGIIFLTLPIEPIYQEVTHLVFAKKQIEQLLSKHFKTLDHFIDTRKHYCVFAVKKNTRINN